MTADGRHRHAHKAKAGATLTGAEYEAADHHVISIAAADIGAAESGHNHDAAYATTGHPVRSGATTAMRCCCG